MKTGTGEIDEILGDEPKVVEDAGSNCDSFEVVDNESCYIRSLNPNLPDPQMKPQNMADIIELDVSKPVPEHGVADLLDRLTTRLALTEVKVGSTQYQLENLGSGLEDTMLQLREQLERQSSALEGAMSRIKRLEDEALAQRKTAEDCPLVAKAPLITKGDKSKIKWAGYEWVIHDDGNYWSSQNVWVDDRNRLHLQIQWSKEAKGWTSAQVYTTEKLGFGTYRWFVQGKLHQLDPHVHLSMFSALRGSDYRDLRIEVHGGVKNLLFSAHPARKDHKGEKVLYYNKMWLNGSDPYSTTHAFEWNRNFVSFRSQHAFLEDPGQWVIAQQKTPGSFVSLVPDTPGRVYMELWVGEGKPCNEYAEEVIIDAFKFTPE